MFRYDKNLTHILPNLDLDEAKIVPVTQDKTTLYVNDGIKQYWSPKDEYGLQRKSQGSSIHISDFVCETIRRLKLSDYEIAINDLLSDSICLKYTKADGTKKPLLHAGKYHDSSKHIIIYRDSNSVLKPKGIKRVLEEKGLWIPGFIKKSQSDFASQRSCLRKINKIRRFTRYSECFMSTYEFGLSGKAVDYVVKKYRSHHRIPEQVLEEFARD
ncbi:20603_t:CDS:2 [Dentiscutata erythropus]|uniref:20603_t:CDS:1 n=1 Tax=Dentiscutata erythropus TaxID=1348616 RepID=A0A9N9FG68_9GLOM|nr:20603_t:CDS:2 [Dentiscutata erythropus]